MPILIILLFYIHDLVKIKRYYSQTEFVAQQMANMIQNISQKRINKKITKKDLENIHVLAWKTIYPGLSMFLNNSVFPLHHKPCVSVYYVKADNTGKASCVWKIWFVKDKITDVYLQTETDKTTDYHISKVKFLTNTFSANIYPTLKINPGETKCIIETSLERDPNGDAFGKISDRAALNLYLVTPKILDDDGWSHMFYSVIIFTPKPGLFDETPPQ